MQSNRVSRRAVLTSGAVFGLGSLGGCSQIASLTSSPPKLGRILVENRDVATHTVHLLVERDGDIVYWQSFDLEATEENDQGQTVRDIERFHEASGATLVAITTSVPASITPRLPRTPSEWRQTL